MITHEMLQMIRSHMTYGDPFMAMQQYFSQDDSVFSDMQQVRRGRRHYRMGMGRTLQLGTIAAS